MINKKIIEKLSDRELENYIKPDSRFMGMAISYAYEILQSRGKTFSEDEKLRIEQMISQKTNAEQAEKAKFSKGWDQNMTKNETAVELYSNKFIWIYSVIFGVILGAVLQAMNFNRLKNTKGVYLSILFGVLYTIFQVSLLTYIEDRGYKIPNGTFLFSALGAAGLFYIRERWSPKNLEYRSRSFIIPVVVAIIIYTPIVYIMIMGIIARS
jgi:hypothetical protein